MDDRASVMSSVYWDAASMMSYNTIATNDEDFVTPTGSLSNLESNCGYRNSMFSTDDDSEIIPVVIQSEKSEFKSFSFLDDDVTDTLQRLEVSDYKKDQIYDKDQEVEIQNDDNSIDINNECNNNNNNNLELKTEDEKIETITEQNDADKKTENAVSKRKKWRTSLSKRFSLKSRFFKSFSHSSEHPKQTDTVNKKSNNFVKRMRNSMRKLPKFSSLIYIKERNNSESASAVLGSDMGYFNYEKTSPLMNQDDRKIFNNLPDTPVKPRRYFTQDKYITGMSEKASEKRRSQIHDDKSLMDNALCVEHILLAGAGAVTGGSQSSYKSKRLSEQEEGMCQIFTNCISRYLECSWQQVDHGIGQINDSLSMHIDLMSDDLQQIDDPSNTKYALEGLLGSPGVCIATNKCNNKQYVVLKKGTDANWVSITSLLQHIEPDVNPLQNQNWVAYPAQTITNLGTELRQKSVASRTSSSLTTSNSIILLKVLWHLIFLLFSHSHRHKTSYQQTENDEHEHEHENEQQQQQQEHEHCGSSISSRDNLPSLAFKPSNFLIFASDISLIVVYNPLPQTSFVPHSPVATSPTSEGTSPFPVTIRGDFSTDLKNDLSDECKIVKERYHKLLLNLNNSVSSFANHLPNAVFLITASYPLDFLFYLLLKLHRDIKQLLDSS